MIENGTTLEAADIATILKSLPHRYPFLMVDRVINIRGDQSCIGIKNVTANEPQFMGHFPERPIFPGVLLIEGMAQTAGVICVLAEGMAEKKSVFFLTIDQAKFRKLVVPGDTIEYPPHVLFPRLLGHVILDGFASWSCPATPSSIT